MKEPIGVGVIGAGYWGRKLIGEYLAAQQNKGTLRLIKICDSSLPALLECEKKYSIEYNRFTKKVEDVISSPKVRAVHIATPNSTHYSLAKMALEAGKDVLVEKPMTLNSQEAYELVDLAASNDLVLHVGHIFRFNSGLQTARKMLKEKVVGRIFYARIQWTDYCPPFQDRDIIFDLGSHPIDVLNQLLEDWPAQVSGFGRAFRGSQDREEVAYGIAEFHDGVFAHVELSWLHPLKVRQVSIIGSEATLTVDCVDQKVTVTRQGTVEEIPVIVNNTIESEIDHFIDCVSRRYTSTDSGLIGAQTVEVLETIRASVWDRPLPALPIEVRRSDELIETLKLANGNGFGGKHFRNTRPEGYVEILLRAGFLRKTSADLEPGFEITESGAQFLKEYQDNFGREDVRNQRKIREAQQLKG